MEIRKGFLLLLFLFLIPTAFAENQTSEIEQDFLEIDVIISELSSEGFNIQRVNDTYKAAKQIFDSQIENQKDENRRDYTLVIKYIDEIFELNDQAYVAKDEIEYVYILYNDIKEKAPQIDLSEAETLLEEMEFEYENEVYDKAYELAKQAYAKLVELEGKYTALNLAYQATTKTIKNFFKDNWLVILILIIVGTILYTIFRNRIIYFRTKHRIKMLEKEAKVLESLIKNAQEGYFETGTLSEASYRVRLKKFSELTRDINRKLPLLREELVKRKGGKIGKTFEERTKEKKETKGKKKDKKKESFLDRLFKKKKSTKNKKVAKKKSVKKKHVKKKTTKKTKKKK
jgi:hypothetical protein